MIFRQLHCLALIWVLVATPALAANVTMCARQHLGKAPNIYISQNGTCTKGYAGINLPVGVDSLELEARLATPIVGIPYEYHITTGYGEVTGWAILKSSGLWYSRLRISWTDSTGHHEEGEGADSHFFPGVQERMAVIQTYGGNLFVWWHNPTPEHTFPVLYAAWSNGDPRSRHCSRLDIHDDQNTYEYFYDFPAQCPEDIRPPDFLLYRPFGGAENKF
jgi:hypothetical protein